MNVSGSPGARFALWWVAAVTRTAEPDIALDRRAEIASDVHEQLTTAWPDLPAASRSVVGRVIRGVPSDIAWRVGLEVRPGRFAWHLRNPSTAITFLFVAMIPLNVAADSNLAATARGDHTWLLLDYTVPLWVATDFVGVCILLIAGLALATRVWPRWRVAAERFEPGSGLERARRFATASLGIALAGSAVFRFGAVGLLGGIFWLAFAAFVVLYAALLLVTLGLKVLTLGRYLPKVRT